MGLTSCYNRVGTRIVLCISKGHCIAWMELSVSTLGEYRHDKSWGATEGYFHLVCWGRWSYLQSSTGNSMLASRGSGPGTLVEDIFTLWGSESSIGQVVKFMGEAVV